MQVAQLQQGVVSQTTTLEKILKSTLGNCIHTNIVQVKKLEEAKEKQRQMKIISSKNSQTENSLIREIQLIVEEKKIRIEDVYKFNFNSTGQVSKGINKKSKIFASSSNSSENDLISKNGLKMGKKIKKRDRLKKSRLILFSKKSRSVELSFKTKTKNIPKNFCRAFLHYMQQKQHLRSGELQLALEQFQNLSKNNLYNNKIIQQILNSNRLRKYFKDFLQNYAEEWIVNTSKINNKEVHLEAIKVYIDLLEKGTYAEIDGSGSGE